MLYNPQIRIIYDTFLYIYIIKYIVGKACTTTQGPQIVLCTDERESEKANEKKNRANSWALFQMDEFQVVWTGIYNLVKVLVAV